MSDGLKEIAKETLQILDAGSYHAPGHGKHDIGAAQKAAEEGTLLYKPEQLARLLKQRHEETDLEAEVAFPVIEVWQAKTQEAARLLAQQGERFVLLNFASARHPGGGFLTGARAQEEDLARCSGLYRCLTRQPSFYESNRMQSSMLYTDHIIYSPNVPFFRDEENKLLPAPYLASVITAPAPNAGQHGRKRKGGPGEVANALRRRAGYVLAVAREQKQRTLLLGAWGCGVFRNDPTAVADAFARWLMPPPEQRDDGEMPVPDSPFVGAFDRVVFGIYDASQKQTTMNAFVERFGDPQTPS